MTHEWTRGPTKWTEGNTLFVSVPFTWNLPEVMREARHPDMFHKRVIVGGPAVKLAKAKLPELLADLPEWVEIGDQCEGALQRMNPQATRTTVGCVRRCSFCAVPITEGDFRELEDWADLPIICDNNLLAASPKHFDRVCDRLERHRWCDFNQGLDARLMNNHHAERIGRLRGAQVRLALDHSALTDAWTRAYELLRKHKVAKARISTYVLCGHGSDPADAWKRCQHVDKRGHPAALPQWYHPLDATEYNAVLPCHRECGWDKAEKNRIMGYYYQHRGELPNAPADLPATAGNVRRDVGLSEKHTHCCDGCNRLGTTCPVLGTVNEAAISCIHRIPSANATGQQKEKEVTNERTH